MSPAAIHQGRKQKKNPMTVFSQLNVRQTSSAAALMPFGVTCPKAAEAEGSPCAEGFAITAGCPGPGRGRAAVPGPSQRARSQAKPVLPPLPSLPRPSLCGTVHLYFLQAGEWREFPWAGPDASSGSAGRKNHVFSTELALRPGLD